MSLFDKDLVERSTDYSDDPEENTDYQIRRALIRFSRGVSEWSSYIDSVFYVKDKIGDFMYDLLNQHIPEGFLGPFKKIDGYHVTVTSTKIPIIKVAYRFEDIDEYKEIQFIPAGPLRFSNYE
jgi:hypothetical protein